MKIYPLKTTKSRSNPHLLRYRVSNKKEDDYYSSYSDSMEETYQNHSDELNRSIRRHFFPDTTAPDFCWNIGTSLQDSPPQCDPRGSPVFALMEMQRNFH